MKGAVITHPELFSDLVHRSLGVRPRHNEYGVYLEADETLAITETMGNGRRTGRSTERWEHTIAEIELLDLRTGRWIGSYGYSLPLGGSSGPLTTMFGWDGKQSMAQGPTREACLEDCRERLAKSLAAYVASHGATKQTRRIAAWLAKLA